MTEPHTPDQQVAVDETGAPANSNRRALTLGALAVGVLLLLFVASRLLLGGGEEEPQELGGPIQPRPTTPTTSELGPDGAVGRPTESFEVFSTKNPFTPLINPPSGGGPTPGGATPGGGAGAGGGATATTIGGGAGGGGGTTQTTIGGGGGGGGGGGTTATTQPGGASGGQPNEPRRQERVALLDVLRRDGRLVAQVRVNNTVYTVGEGEVFADNYRVLSIDEENECGRFIFGDEQFRLCKGEETLK